MNAAVVNKHGGQFEIKTVPVPDPGQDQVLVRIITSGLCHTDIHARDGDWPVPSKLPLIAGHEGAGIVEKIGENVKNLRVGDRVGVAWLHSACGDCEFCISGKETLCSQQENTGYSVDGAFAEYVLSRASHTVKLPDNLSYKDAAPILCAGVTTYKGLKESEVKPGQFITIIGAAGGLGHLAIQYAVAMGMRVIAVDMPDKLEFCKNLGAERALNCLDPDTVQNIVTFTGGGSHGILCVAASPKAFDLAVNMCRPNGTIILIGLPKGYFQLPVFNVVLKGITIRGSIVGTRKDLNEALDLASRGKVIPQVTTCPFHDIENAAQELIAGRVKGRLVLEVETK